jgi:hypothetical protein
MVEFNGAPDVRAITSAHGVPTRTMRARRAVVADISNLDLRTLARIRASRAVMADRPAWRLLERTAQAIGLPAASCRRPETGRGVGIAVIDSGVIRAARRPVALAGGAARGRVQGLHPSSADSTGRTCRRATGSVTARTWPASWRQRLRLVGTPPRHRARANLIALKALDDEGLGFVSSVIEAIDYAVANRTPLSIRVINLSSAPASSSRTTPIRCAGRQARRGRRHRGGGVRRQSRAERGARVAVRRRHVARQRAVGAHRRRVEPPGTVSRSDDRVAAFSSLGPTWIRPSAKPDLVAPASGIESLADPHSVL